MHHRMHAIPPRQLRPSLMIIFDIRLGRFSVLDQRETDSRF